MKNNTLKKKIANGQKVIGTWNTASSSVVTDVIASTGIDFVFIDFEHGPLDFKNIGNYVNSCLAYNVSPIVRVPSNDASLIQQALDQGAHGIICPYIETKEDAQKLVQSSMYYPKGSRGYTPFTKAGQYGQGNIKEHTGAENESNLIFALVESVKGLENINEISKVDGIDLIFFGSFDISQSLGMPGDVKNELVVKKITDALKIVKKNGKHAGAYLATSEKEVNWVLDQGFDFVVYGVDTGILAKEYSRAVEALKIRK